VFAQRDDQRKQKNTGIFGHIKKLVKGKSKKGKNTDAAPAEGSSLLRFLEGGKSRGPLESVKGEKEDKGSSESKSRGPRDKVKGEKEDKGSSEGKSRGPLEGGSKVGKKAKNGKKG